MDRGRYNRIRQRRRWEKRQRRGKRGKLCSLNVKKRRPLRCQG